MKQFRCPECGSVDLEVILDGSHSATISISEENNYFDCTVKEFGDTVRYQCENCLYPICDEDGDPIIYEEDAIAWINENC